MDRQTAAASASRLVTITAAEIELLETQIADGGDIRFEQNYPTLLNYYRSSGDGLAAARIALRIFIIYNKRMGITTKRKTS